MECVLIAFAGLLMPRQPDSDLNDAQRGRQLRGNGSDDLVDRDGQMPPPMHNTPHNAQAYLPTSSMIGGNPMKQPGPGLHMTPSLGASSINPASVQPMMPPQLGKPQNLPQGQPIRGQIAGTQPVQQNMLHQQQQHIVQQLRMAVQAGLISPQLLNQQLTPNMLVMLQHLLQAQQVLQQLVNQQQQLLQKPRMNPVNPIQQRQKLEQLSTYIQQVQQQIQTTQQNIKVAQQSLLTKQQPSQLQQQPPQVSLASPADLQKDVNKDLQNDHLSMKEVGLSESRLTKWKLPSPEKDFGVAANSENRPVGARAGQHPHSNLQSSTSLPFSDNTWSSSSLSTTASWPTTSSSAISTTSVASGDQVESKDEGDGNKDSSLAPISSASPIDLAASGSDTPTSSGDANAGLDLIEEFVPGKPWQGSGIKSVEDDPYITPGSVTRSRLSVNTIREDYLSNLGKTTNGSPTVGSETLGSWSLGPQLSKSSSSQNLLTDVKSTWSTTSGVEPTSTLDPEFWAGPNVPKPRPPPGLPPGLGSKGPPPSQSSQGGPPSGFSRSVSWAPGDRSAFTSKSSLI